MTESAEMGFCFWELEPGELANAGLADYANY